MTLITWACLRCVQELATILGPENPTQRSCDQYLLCIRYGGSVFLWDPRTQLGFAYVPTYLAWYDREKRRGVACLQAVYSSLREQNMI